MTKLKETFQSANCVDIHPNPTVHEAITEPNLSIEDQIAGVRGGTLEYTRLYRTHVFNQVVQKMLPAKTDYQKIKLMLSLLLLALFRPTNTHNNFNEEIQHLETITDIRKFIIKNANLITDDSLTDKFLSNWIASAYLLCYNVTNVRKFFEPLNLKGCNDNNVEYNFYDKNDHVVYLKNSKNKAPNYLSWRRPVVKQEKSMSVIFKNGPISQFLINFMDPRKGSFRDVKCELYKIMKDMLPTESYNALIKNIRAILFVQKIATYALCEYEHGYSNKELIEYSEEIKKEFFAPEKADKETSEVVNDNLNQTVDNTISETKISNIKQEFSWGTAMSNFVSGNNEQVAKAQAKKKAKEIKRLKILHNRTKKNVPMKKQEETDSKGSESEGITSTNE